MDGLPLLLLAVLVPGMSLIGQTQGATRPHIILIVADDLGYNDVSFHGSNQIPTPNIDRLAYGGVLLNNYYVSPICTPTRSALMTGRHPIHTGMQTGVIFGDQPYGLPLSEKLLPQYLKPLGYRSHMVGKWHLGMFAKEYTPLYRGFESHLGYYQGCEDYYDHSYEAIPAQWGYDFRRDMTVMYNYTGKYSTTVFTEEALSVINRHNTSEPLFLYLPYQAVHSGNADSPTPLEAPQEYIDRFPHIENKQRRIYAAMVSALDDGVGAVYDALQKRGMGDNSIIVFTTDNGGPANGFDYNAANNFPLRGLKATLWEGGVRGVGFINSPLLTKPGYVSDKMLHVCDWLPTLYEAAGGDPATLVKKQKLDGVSAWKMLSMDGAAVRSEMLHNIDPIQKFAGIRVGEYKLVTGNIGHGYSDWYPPWQLSGDEVRLHVDRFSSDGAKNRLEDESDDDEEEEEERKNPQVLSSMRGEVGGRDDYDNDRKKRNQRSVKENLSMKYRRPLSLENAAEFPDSDFFKGGFLKNSGGGFYNDDNGERFSLRNVLNSDSGNGRGGSFGGNVERMSITSEDEILSGERLSLPEFMSSSSSSSSSSALSSGPVTVNCGEKPANASTNCQPEKAPCLFHILSDPCEYNNIADSNPAIVAQLFQRLMEYAYGMIPPGNQPCDDRGNPKYHNNTWVPWILL